MTRGEIMAAITDERERQHRKWDRDHDHGHGDCSSAGVPDLTEETGEVARAFLDGDRNGLRRELVQVAAVAMAWLEAL